MNSWEDEQRDYLDKSDAEQMAAFFIGAIVVAVIVALAAEIWQRCFG